MKNHNRKKYKKYNLDLKKKKFDTVSGKSSSFSKAKDDDYTNEKGFFPNLINSYFRNYKKLLIIPILMLIIAISLITVQYINTGEIVNRGISLKGGTSYTITDNLADINDVSLVDLKNTLSNSFPDFDFQIRELNDMGSRIALIIEVDVTENEELINIQEVIVQNIPNLTLENLQQNVQITGSSLGESFFKQIGLALLLAFLFMAIVVFIQFRVPIPSMGVVLCAFSDIVITLAIINLMGMKLSSSGIAAFLMLVGYSVDTDILMATRVLKSKEGSVKDRILSSIKTGMVMNLTTLAAITAALLISNSEIIVQIMTILFIGLIIDIINTWIQNAGILMLYMERKSKKGDMK